MTCERVQGKGFAMTICQRGKRWPPCSVDGCKRRAPKLCDFPTANGTCDAKLCEAHAAAQGPELDYCPLHARQMRLAL